MTRSSLLSTRQITRLAALCALAGFSFASHAQASRTWVSGVGDDANPCTRTAPCKTWAGAISKTVAGGEIDAIDPGGFGAVTITKSITIDGGAGQVSGALTPFTHGIIVNSATADVILRNISLHGLDTGLNGVRVLAAKTVRLQNVKIERFSQNCISIEPGASPVTVHILDTVAAQCAKGLSVTSTATTATPPWAATVAADRSRFVFNTTAGVAATGANALVQLSGSTVFGNALGLSATSQGSITSSGTNQTLGNTANGSFTGTTASN